MLVAWNQTWKNVQCSSDPEFSHFKCSPKRVETIGHFTLHKLKIFKTSLKSTSAMHCYTGCIKKMVIELWRAIGHSIFNIQK